MPRYKLNVNSKEYNVDVDAQMPMLWVIRDFVGLKGTKFGCGIAQCGACTVLVNGEAVRSCVYPVSAVGKQKVETIESLEQKGELSKIQKAWVENEVPQCGYCQSGQIMSAVALLKTNNKPTDEDIDAAMQGNLCRCGTYQRIRAAIHLAAELV